MSDEELARRLAARTLELVDIPSESRDEAAIAQHLMSVVPGARDAGDGCVLVGDGPIVLAGHLDTVPAQGNRPGRADGEAVHGLGASDMKAALAVMVELAIAGRAPGTTLCFFPREELPVSESSLTPLLAREPALRDADVAIVMEPTDNAIHAGCLGNVNATWTFHGVSGHSARPWLADNAIERAARAIAELADAAPPARLDFDGLEFVESVSIVGIEGGIARNVIPDRASAQVNYRYSPGRSAADADARLHALCDGEGRELVIESNAPSAPVAVSHPFVQRLVESGSLEVLPKQAWTPVAEFALVGVPAVNFGPGDPAYAHRRDELVGIEALVRSFRALESVLCG
ncbi:MAG: succinyl-diaminopimelate desuccinylase [Solirubrobacteraceae bacterium]|nr:succinyl-diaminopimelate desuccinylase [Solirubrobacteraceae bacterium]